MDFLRHRLRVARHLLYRAGARHRAARGDSRRLLGEHRYPCRHGPWLVQLLCPALQAENCMSLPGKLIPERTKKDQASIRLRLRVTSTAESILRSGHPWLFADSIHEQNRPGILGELAVIYDRKD